MRFMMRFQTIGVLANKAVVNHHGADSVINFSIRHTETKNVKGVPTKVHTWIDCAWWTPKTHLARDLRRGTRVYIDGFPTLKSFERNDGTQGMVLSLRISSLETIFPESGSEEPPENEGPQIAPNDPTEA